ALANDLAVEMNRASFRDPVKVYRFPARNGLTTLKLLLAHLHHDSRSGADLSLCPLKRFVHHQAPEPLGELCRICQQLDDLLKRQGDLYGNGVFHERSGSNFASDGPHGTID